jgi:hypothetical protein
VQVRDLAPGPADAFVRILERRDEFIPGGLRLHDGRDGGAAVGEQLLDRGRYMLGLDLREARQTREIKERILLLRQHAGSSPGALRWSSGRPRRAPA